MKSFDTHLTVSALTNATARVVHDIACLHTNYFRLRIDAKDFIRCSPEIAYLDAQSRAQYVPRDKMQVGFPKIVALSRQLTEAFMATYELSNPVVSLLELEAVEIGERWCVSVRVIGTIPGTNRRVERNQRYRILCADRPCGGLAA